MTNFSNPRLSRESLRIILKDLNTIPDEHRLKLWIETILHLPNNKAQYLNLRKSGKNIPLQVSLHIQNETKCKTVTRIIQCLQAHCPSLKQFRNFNLVDFVEPFACLLGTHEMIYFEVMLSILVNWCQHWFDHIPLPPYTLLSMMDIIFLKNHPELYSHLASKGIRAMDFAWKWMSNSFKTIVDSKEWLVLWDHILINEPSFMYYIPLAACKLQDRHLLECSTHGEIMNVLHSPTPFDAQSILKETYQLNEVTPKELQMDQMLHPFHPMIIGYYPTLNPTDLITFHSESGTLNSLNNLLAQVEETDGQIDMVIQEGMTLRKWMMDK